MKVIADSWVLAAAGQTEIERRGSDVLKDFPRWRSTGWQSWGSDLHFWTPVHNASPQPAVPLKSLLFLPAAGSGQQSLAKGQADT